MTRDKLLEMQIHLFSMVDGEKGSLSIHMLSGVGLYHISMFCNYTQQLSPPLHRCGKVGPHMIAEMEIQFMQKSTRMSFIASTCPPQDPRIGYAETMHVHNWNGGKECTLGEGDRVQDTSLKNARI